MAPRLGCFQLFSIFNSMNDHGSSLIFIKLFPWGKFSERDKKMISKGYEDLQVRSQH